MSNEVDVRQTIKTQVEQLGPVLHSGVSSALAAAQRRTHALEHPKYPHLLPFLLRAELREFLETSGLPSDWTVKGDPRLMGQLLLSNTEHNIEIRFLKERRSTYPQGVPTAGDNGSRRKYWSDIPLDLDFLALESNPSARRSSKPIQLLLLWDFLKPQNLDEFTLRVVHTVDPGTYGQAVQCDLVLDLKDGGEIFNHLAFEGSEDEQNFFPVEIDHEMHQGGF